MVNGTSVSPNALMDTLSIHREIAKGAISIATNPADNGMAVGSFTELIKHKIAEINQDQNHSSMLMRAVDSGKSDDLVGAMVASQKASLSFSTMIQIRNRLVQAFDDVMKMPV
ncbi:MULTISPECIES: flagellar hook-basal body complex protein FliE [Shewanella]|uniref:Flagellar hook-basal body complex protein FliE n=1 Tax=Shewanella salipaludis TaxID=2723052 RepID=A0A972FV90_9GAMM|nr:MULTISPECIES: flagellar hook-basal body complex protein FliE [Shewanella]MCE9686243.1 flagellar hook-basal body complex protein FliE [Shewanella sp. AS16]NMH66745.1 flagellar hook-basal body complex protein FliE [Shewanella salipaludis]